MELRRAGRTGLDISRLGLGTMTWGRDTDEHEAADQCRAYIEAGGNFIDTAATYGDGDSERVIGGLIGTLFNREQVVLATKAGISFVDGERKVDASRHGLISQLEKSLIRLGTDYVDLWQIHSWDSNIPLEDTLSALDFAYTSGKARYVGISNYSGWQSARAITLQESHSMKAPIATLQNEYSLLNRSVEEEVLESASQLGVGFLAWSPIGRGDSRGASPHFAHFIDPYLDERSSRIVDAVCVAAQGLGYSPLEVALSWVRDAPGVTSAIIGARTGAQLRGALTTEQITLPDIVREALNDISEF
jgi:aryl-alcohol dehydrogenase-like predicted oxidoreductase